MQNPVKCNSTAYTLLSGKVPPGKFPPQKTPPWKYPPRKSPPWRLGLGLELELGVVTLVTLTLVTLTLVTLTLVTLTLTSRGTFPRGTFPGGTFPRTLYFHTKYCRTCCLVWVLILSSTCFSQFSCPHFGHVFLSMHLVVLF